MGRMYDFMQSDDLPGSTKKVEPRIRNDCLEPYFLSANFLGLVSRRHFQKDSIIEKSSLIFEGHPVVLLCGDKPLRSEDSLDEKDFCGVSKSHTARSNN